MKANDLAIQLMPILSHNVDRNQSVYQRKLYKRNLTKTWLTTWTATSTRAITPHKRKFPLIMKQSWMKIKEKKNKLLILGYWMIFTDVPFLYCSLCMRSTWLHLLKDALWSWWSTNLLSVNHLLPLHKQNALYAYQLEDSLFCLFLSLCTTLLFLFVHSVGHSMDSNYCDVCSPSF